MTKKIGPKETALKAMREEKRPRGHVRLAKMVEDMPKAVREAREDSEKAKAMDDKKAMDKYEGIPTFLKRTETEEQAAKRDAKYAAKKTDPKLKVIEPYNPNDPVRKAIAKDLAADLDQNKTAGGDVAMSAAAPKSKKAKSLLSAAMNGEISTADALSAIKRLPKGKTKKQPIAVHGPDLPNGPGLARLRASPKAETIRKDNLKKVENASVVKDAKKEKPTLTGKKAILFDTAVAAGKKGITLEALAKKVGWQRCSYTLKQVCQQMHAKLEVRDDLVFVTK